MTTPSYTIVLIGHRNHVEVQGTVGEAPKRINAFNSDAPYLSGSRVANTTSTKYPFSLSSG